MEHENILQTFIEHSSTHELITNDVLLAPKSKQVIDLEQFAENPRRIKAELSFNDLRGFIDYINDYKSDISVCFAGSDQIKVIFDYHVKDHPEWGTHKAIFNLKKSKRWSIWEDAHNKWMLQKDFANFLDSGLNEIIKPNQTEILTLVKNFRATLLHEFDSEATPGGGESLTYRKVTKGGTSNEKIQLPEYITLALQPFENLTVINDQLSDTNQIPAYELKAKISWQINVSSGEEHGLSFKVQILNVEGVINKTLEIIKNAVVELTEVKTYIA